MMMTNILPAFELLLNEQGDLSLIAADGSRHDDVVAVRCFPLTDAERWWSLCDAHGRELVCIEDPRQLPDSVRRVFAEHRSRREFQPIIQRIHRIEHGPNAVAWDVTTDRGRHEFTVKSDDDVRRLPAGPVLIIDAHGIRYRIPDVARLDHASRHLLDRFL